MATTQSDAADPRIPDLLDHIAEHVGDDEIELVSRFVTNYYLGLPKTELSTVATQDLCGAALSHWRIASLRSPGQPKIHIYNPRADEHGWQSGHTVIDIVTDDMPFLVDSIQMALSARGLRTFLVIHPVLRVGRDSVGEITSIGAHNELAEESRQESFIHFEVERQTDPDHCAQIKSELLEVLGDVRSAVEDWSAMKARLSEAVIEIEHQPPIFPAEDVREAIALLAWLGDDHFTFLGYREYSIEQHDGAEVLLATPGSGLGILQSPVPAEPSESFVGLPPEIRRQTGKIELLVASKANTKSTIHRPGYYDYIGITRLDSRGRVIGERRFVGLYASTAYNSSVLSVPWVRARVARVLDRAPFPRDSHAGRALINILETYPRDELFHIDEDALYDTIVSISRLQERQRVGLFVHRERYGRFYSCLVFVPRDRFNTSVRDRIQKILESTFESRHTEFSVQLSESTLARLYFVLRIDPDHPDVQFDSSELLNRVRTATRSWTDLLADAMLEQFGEERGTALLRRYGSAFRADYREQYSPRTALRDIESIERIANADDIGMQLYRPPQGPPEAIKLKLFHPQRPASLSVVLEILENMGLRIDDSRPSLVERREELPVWIHDFGMAHSEGANFDLDEASERFKEAFERIWRADVENDRFNHLVLRARLRWRDVVVLRAYARYLRQTAIPFSQEYMQETLCANFSIASALVKLFQLRLDPAIADAEAEANMARRIEAALDDVKSLDQDRILRSFLALVRATLRTNFFQLDEHGQPKSYLSVKLDPQQIPALPNPRPKFEVFVYSPSVEGVHLRGGAVARGGLRWSDRREDFRTEILGLMRAQMVKNAVIVPVGAKGGFVAKSIPDGSDKSAVLAEGEKCYSTFIRGLLDLTDNIEDGTVVPPPDVVRHDGDDPYLVVAADKGTATFSDLANEIAAGYGFWLADAFASGGSAGYDHKRMGITARGAWESVKRHFRELGRDIQRQPFTVVGIGDMSGDVFGNGMLLSEQILLVGAFNHSHIFLDPNPDAASSYAERRRLFGLARSSWEDYDSSIISPGGGVFSRSAKSVPLSSEARAVLGTDVAQLTPNELIRALLEAPVDLLWNGGIGTYVKAKSETDAAVGDRTNDGVRVNGADLRCRVVGEGGNLGLTQRGRTEYALAGGRINTDSIDNSAGVDCSDHEVNIKILLNQASRRGDLTLEDRNRLLESMTDEVAGLVLRTNYRQSGALSLAAAQSAPMLDVHARLLHRLEQDGRLDRLIEGLPDAEELEDRGKSGKGLTQPELAVLMGHVKLRLYSELLRSDLPESAYFVNELARYFPQTLQQRFSDQMAGHPLAREIICTSVVNQIVNHAGITFVFRIQDETGAAAADVARAYVVAREIFGLLVLWRDVDALDNVAAASAQAALFLEARKLLERATRWLLRNKPQPLSLRDDIRLLGPGIAEFERTLRSTMDTASAQAREARKRRFAAPGVPDSLAETVAGYPELISGLDIVEVAHLSGSAVREVAATHFSLSAALDLYWIRSQIDSLPRHTRWQSLARAALREELYARERSITTAAVRVAAGPGESRAEATRWLDAHANQVARCHRLIAELKEQPSVDHTMLSAAVRELRALSHDAPVS